MCNDERGTDRFIYMLSGGSDFWRYDTWTDSFQRLANPPAIAFGAGCSLAADPNFGPNGSVWMFAPQSSGNYNVFAVYDIATDSWTSKATVSGLGSQWGTDGCLVHTCTAYNADRDDDAIYLIGNNSTVWYKYSKGADTWTVMGTGLPVAAGAGSFLVWSWNYDSDKLYYAQGGTSGTVRTYSISVGTFAAVTLVPGLETVGTGTTVAYDADKRIFIQKDNSLRFLFIQLDENRVYPAGALSVPTGTSHVGDGLVLVRSPKQEPYLYFRKHSSSELYRTLIFQ